MTDVQEPSFKKIQPRHRFRVRGLGSVPTNHGQIIVEVEVGGVDCIKKVKHVVVISNWVTAC